MGDLEPDFLELALALASTPAATLALSAALLESREERGGGPTTSEGRWGVEGLDRGLVALVKTNGMEGGES